MEEQWMEDKIGTYVFLKLPKHSKRLGQLKGEGKMWIAKQEITMAFVQKKRSWKLSSYSFSNYESGRVGAAIATSHLLSTISYSSPILDFNF